MIKKKEKIEDIEEHKGDITLNKNVQLKRQRWSRTALRRKTGKENSLIGCVISLHHPTPTHRRENVITLNVDFG